jgi:hypothetical protein
VLRLFRLIVVLGGLAAMTWFALTVRLGDRTLFEHAQAIWNTHESQDLVKGTKERMGDLVERATDEVAKGVTKKVPSHASSRGDDLDENGAKTPMEEVGEHDRKQLRGLIGSRTGKL